MQPADLWIVNCRGSWSYVNPHCTTNWMIKNSLRQYFQSLAPNLCWACDITSTGTISDRFLPRTGIFPASCIGKGVQPLMDSPIYPVLVRWVRSIRIRKRFAHLMRPACSGRRSAPAVVLLPCRLFCFWASLCGPSGSLRHPACGWSTSCSAVSAALRLFRAAAGSRGFCCSGETSPRLQLRWGLGRCCQLHR